MLSFMAGGNQCQVVNRNEMRGDGLFTQYYQIHVIYMIIINFKGYCPFRFIVTPLTEYMYIVYIYIV